MELPKMDDSLTFLFIPHLMFYNWQILRQSLLFMRNVVFGTYFLALLGGVTITIGGGAAISLLPPAQSLWGGGSLRDVLTILWAWTIPRGQRVSLTP